MSPKERMVLYKSRRAQNPLFHKIEGKKTKKTESEIAKKIYETAKKKINEIQNQFNDHKRGVFLIKKLFLLDVNKKRFANNKMFGTYKIYENKIVVNIILDENINAKIDTNKYLGGDTELSLILDTIEKQVKRNKQEIKPEYYEFNTPEHIFKGRLGFKTKIDFINQIRYKKE
jgi:hypothetical protein